MQSFMNENITINTVSFVATIALENGSLIRQRDLAAATISYNFLEYMKALNAVVQKNIN